MAAQDKIPHQTDDMRLSKFEFLAMNNPFHRWLQKHIEFRIFKNQLASCGITLESKVIMDAGCGSGHSTQLIINEFHPSHVVAFDYMPEQINLARKRKLGVDFFVGDLTKLDPSDATFDAVFILRVLHHIPEWRKALFEVSRVLKPGGVMLVHEFKESFDWNDFESGIKDAGLDILQVKKIVFDYFRAYLCRKTG